MGLTFMASLSVMKASTATLTAWTFDNLSSGTTNTSPQPSTGLGTAGALGMANSYNNTNSLSNPIVVSLAGSSSGGPNAWQISGNGAAPNGGDGWSTSAPIGTQGAQFSGSTYGYYNVSASFDVYVPSTGEANLQVEYTTEGNLWVNAGNITVSGGSATVNNNTTSTNTVNGTYVKLATGWNNGITVNLGGISGVDNDPNFAIRIVNASTGPDDVDTTGAAYNNTSGNWTLDNVVIQGVSIDTIADWTFASYASGGIYSTNSGYVENPIPEINFAYESEASAACIGFDITNFQFASGVDFSTNAPDVTSQAGSSTPGNPSSWRMRGAPGNGWTSVAPNGSQGGEFDVSTVNYSNIVVTFDIYFTSAAEARMCVLYTTNGWTNSFTANTLAYAPNPQYILTNDQTADPNTIEGTYFYQTAGQNWYNQLAVDFTGIPNVDNNPLFGIRIVNASSNVDDVAYNGFPYNNNSGNARLGNVLFGGQYNGLVPPSVSAASGATVDNPFTNTFADNANWRASISAVYINGQILPPSAYNANNAGMLIFTPALSTLLQLAAVDSIIVYATNYSTVRITQPIAAGAFKNLNNPVGALGPSASGGTLEVNPVLVLADQYGNSTTNPYANVVVTATAGGASGWTLGGATVQPEVNGVITFTNLSATLATATPVTGAAVMLNVTGYTNAATKGSTTNITLSTFNIGVAPVPFTPGNLAIFQVDTLSNNTTFSMIEVKSSATNPAPVNIVPVSATGTNALRESPAGTTGRLALSDDGTLLTFGAFADGSSATPDETLNLNRAAVGMNYTNGVSIGATYTSTSLGGSQARAAATLDDVNFFADDKGGLYYGSGYVFQANVDALNNVVVKCFGPQANSIYPGHTAYVETQKAVSGENIPVVYMIYNNGGWITQPNNLGNDPNATDFYLISTNCGTTYDVMYTCDQISSSQGVINKFSWEPGVDSSNPNNEYGWATNGSWTNTVGIDGMFVTTNGVGDAYIYYTTGAGGTAGNSIYRVTDSTGWGANIHIITTNLIYTTPKTASMKGIVFVPQQTANAYEPMPTPILAPASKLNLNSTFNIATIPDDPTWRCNITSVTVNGTAIPSTAYSTNTAGVIAFTPSQASALQTPGVKTITFSVTGYITNSVTQVIVGPATQLVITTQPTAPKADGAVLAKQPVVTIEDASNDVIFAAANVGATATQGTWSLGGNTNLATSAGVSTYTNLGALATSAVTGATITFSSGGLTTNSSAFNIPAPIYSVLHKANVANGKFAFAFTNATGLFYSVLATNNILAPVSTWPAAGTTVENPAGSGTYVFTNSVGANGQVYYILKQQP